MWRLNAMERLIEPLPRGLNRLAAPLLVFIFGMLLPFDYVAAAGGGTVPRFEPEVDLFAPLTAKSRPERAQIGRAHV